MILELWVAVEKVDKEVVVVQSRLIIIDDVIFGIVGIREAHSSG